MRRLPLPWIILACVLASPAAIGQDAPPKENVLLGQPATDYAARRKAVMEQVAKLAGDEPSVILVRGADHRQREDFEEGRFRQKNDFAYLSGVDVPGSWLILLPAKGESTLYLPPKAGPSVFSDQGSNPGPGDEAKALYGFDAVRPVSDLKTDFEAAVGDGAAVYTLAANPSPKDDRPEAKFIRSWKEDFPKAKFRELTATLGEMRKAKMPGEIALLQKAIDITGDANDEVIGVIRPGLYEYQLEGKVVGAFLNGGAMRAGFASIIGSGPNGTIPHYFDNRRKMEDGDLVVVDIGAEYELYTADVTRTYPVNGKFTPRQREIYQLVLDAQKAAEEHMVPGETRLFEMTGFVSNYLSKSPLRAKDEQGRDQPMNRFFIHGLSHYLGMDVHDVGSGSAPMQPGEVFTIEPGLYIKSENIGIRIEDDYLMTKDGLEKLTKGIASTPDEIEAKIARARAEKTSN